MRRNCARVNPPSPPPTIPIVRGRPDPGAQGAAAAAMDSDDVGGERMLQRSNPKTHEQLTFVLTNKLFSRQQRGCRNVLVEKMLQLTFRHEIVPCHGLNNEKKKT
jgi:hypothetical protein